MRIRFISWLAIGVASAFLVVAATAFSLAAVVSLALGIGVGLLLVSGAVAYRYRTHLPTVAASVAAAVVSAWMVVASQIFSQATVRHLTLAEALALAGVAIIGLGVNELSSERVVHSLEVGSVRRESELAAA